MTRSGIGVRKLIQSEHFATHSMSLPLIKRKHREAAYRPRCRAAGSTHPPSNGWRTRSSSMAGTPPRPSCHPKRLNVNVGLISIKLEYFAVSLIANRNEYVYFSLRLLSTFYSGIRDYH